MKISYLYLILLFLALMAIDCTNLAGGNGSETTNGYIAGMLVEEDGSPAAEARVMLITSSYNPIANDPIPDSLIDTTDATGTFRMQAAGGIICNIEAVQAGSGNRALITGLTVIQNDTYYIPAMVIRKPGTIQWISSALDEGTGGYLFIPGTTLFAEIRNGCALLDSVPAGTVPSIAYTENPGSTDNRVISTNLIVASGNTVLIQDSSVWKHSKKIRFNTAKTGADVAGTVAEFPVLIRLRNDNFDFGQAMANGSDLCFRKSDGTPLPYEIERWNVAQQQAELWVKVDTIRGNDSAQSIIMYWGNPVASPLQNSNAVFDTADGFQGVWHLSGVAGDPVNDATANGYHGISPDTARPQVAEGIAGECRLFNGMGDYITMPATADSKLNFPAQEYYTVSAWVHLDTFDNTPHLVVAKGYEQYFLRFTYFPVNAPLWEFSQFRETGSWQACTTSVTAVGRWTLLTGVCLADRQLLYCDGVLVDSLPNNYPADNVSRNTTNDLSIGKFLNTVNIPNAGDDSYCFFRGSIDEVRILGVAQNSDWVKLCYMNQRSDDRLVAFK